MVTLREIKDELIEDGKNPEHFNIEINGNFVRVKHKSEKQLIEELQKDNEKLNSDNLDLWDLILFGGEQ